MPDDNVSMSTSMSAAGAPASMNPASVDSAGMAPAGVPATMDSTGAPAPMNAGGAPAPMNPAASAAPALGQDDVIVSPVMEASQPASLDINSEVPAEVIRKISEAHNVLVALSSDPSVDEMSAAIGVSLFLDKLGKRATAIYSGATPNALEFLKPEETFEPSVDTLQDFVIALNKEKADHLRYKLDGDYVKIYITPYKSKIAESDLEFSYGDYNVDLVLALDVANGVDLDKALREHGRIMHDAVIINITTGNPGKLGEIEWSDKSASSVSEMIAKLLYNVNSEMKIEKEEATAFLTGIVAATNRFSNNRTTPETMRLASRLMESGANQQLVSKNITPDVDNEMIGMLGIEKPRTEVDNDPTKLHVGHEDDGTVDETKVVNAKVTEKESTLLDDLKAAEASLAMAGAEVTPEETKEPIKIDSHDVNEPDEVAKDDALGGSDDDVASAAKDSTTTDEGAKKEMDEGGESLKDASDNLTEKSPEEESDELSKNDNPAAAGAPIVAKKPEINGVPEINYMPLPDDNVLPPPPAPPINMDEPALDFGAIAGKSNDSVGADIAGVSGASESATEPITPALPKVEPQPEPLGAQPAMQDQVYNAQASDPGAFKIPGIQ